MKDQKNSLQIHSMTGFGRGEAKDEDYLLTIEVKSVNHRFKDFRFRMPGIFSAQEISWRKKIESVFKRGSFDISINYKKNTLSDPSANLDMPKIENYLQMMLDISQRLHVQLEIRPTDFLRPEFFLNPDELKLEELIQLADTALELALSHLQDSRKQEGNRLMQVMLSHLDIFHSSLKIIKINSGLYEEDLKDRLLQKLQEYQMVTNIDQNRFLQEVIYYLEKLDVDEEIHRLEIHIQKMQELFQHQGEIGRQVDFLLQEFGRETNTIGSKSAHPLISSAIVKMKLQLEKMREQALNLE